MEGKTQGLEPIILTPELEWPMLIISTLKGLYLVYPKPRNPIDAQY